MIPPFLTVLGFWLFKGIGVLASFVTSGNVFPKPLRREEERKFLLKKAEGDEEARNTLIERNLRLVAHIVKKFDNTGEDTEDLISIGVIGLIKAINTYDLSRNTRLATYAARCIENENSRSKGQKCLFFCFSSNMEIPKGTYNAQRGGFCAGKGKKRQLISTSAGAMSALFQFLRGGAAS